MKARLKPLVLVALGVFLYSQLVNGLLFYYINQRFSWLILLAAFGFLIIAASYQFRSHAADHETDAPHPEPVSWGGLVLLALTVIVGTVVPPTPLGAQAAANRDFQVSSLSSVSQAGAGSLSKTGDKTILEWLLAFQQAPGPDAFKGQEAKVTGFVYRDERLTGDLFMVGRFIVSCCVADATPVGLVVRWPQADSLENDAWVEVTGHLTPGSFAGEPVVILVADTVAPALVPDQPYLYP